MMGNFRIFGLNSSQDFATKVANHLDVELSEVAESYFSDHEPYIRSSVNVRDCDVYIIQSLYHDKSESVADKFLKLLVFIGSLRDASARRITAVMPYLAFQRQDRKTESRAPITTKYIAKALESAGLDRLLTMDVHNLAAFQNAFRIQTDTLEAKNLIADFIAEQLQELEHIVVLSPDSGGMSRAKRFRQALATRLKRDIGLAYLDKNHYGDGISANDIIGDVSGKVVVAVDDMISSGATLAACDKVVEARGGALWAVCATHGLFVGKVNENMASMKRIVVTDTIDSNSRELNAEVFEKLHVISAAKMFSQAIRRTHEEGGSISDLLK